MSISYINPRLEVDNFHDPWSYEIDTEFTILSQNQTQVMIIDHFLTTLETDARSIGFMSRSKIEKKLVLNPVTQVDKSPFLSHGLHPYLWLM